MSTELDQPEETETPEPPAPVMIKLQTLDPHAMASMFAVFCRAMGYICEQSSKVVAVRLIARGEGWTAAPGDRAGVGNPRGVLRPDRPECQQPLPVDQAR